MTTGFTSLWPVIAFCVAVSGCTAPQLSSENAGPFAPGIDTKQEAVSGVEVGHRLIAAREYELAIRAFNRAALENGMDAEILSGLGAANLGLGRLGQAEFLLRRATTDFDAWPEIWNNLAVVLMEQGKVEEAKLTFRKAFALDNGESTVIRDNLRLALAKSENSAKTEPQEQQEYRLVRRGSGDFTLRSDAL
ncbi:MAG: tetratricopeptide repeat protein [Pseudomonadota bacterium]